MLHIHPNARTTPATRAEIAHPSEPSGTVAQRYGISPDNWAKVALQPQPVVPVQRLAMSEQEGGTRPASEPTRMHVPSGSAISIRSASAGAALPGAGQDGGNARQSEDGTPAMICTGIGPDASTRSRTCRRQFRSRPRLTS